KGDFLLKHKKIMDVTPTQRKIEQDKLIKALESEYAGITGNKNQYIKGKEYIEISMGFDCMHTAETILNSKFNKYGAAKRYFEEAGDHFEKAGYLNLAIKMFKNAKNYQEAKRLSKIKNKCIEELKRNL
ncbi:MAG: hypothetical protein M1382_03895, partial [Candidatus Marsarchaeota archaeon]|nr:hypothetical protein [Candidatus Marsarchaeota archaeon]